MKKTLLFIVLAALVIILAIVAYWYFLLNKPSTPVTAVPGNQTEGGGFQPLDRPGMSESPIPIQTSNATTTATENNESPIVVLRQLSKTPVGGFGVFTSLPTKNNPTSSTTIRWIDRGRGNTYEAYNYKPEINTLSNTLVPRIYQSWWNKGLSSFFAQYASTNNDNITTVVASITKVTPSNATTKTSTGTSTATTSTQSITSAPYQLKGTLVSGNIIALAVSPEGDKAVVVVKENNRGIGYISKFDGTGQSQLFDIPLTQITVDWPETNTIAITTKGGAAYAGYLYLINAKNGVMKQILGGIPGLSAKVSHDATRVIYSSSSRSDSLVNTAILDLRTSEVSPVIFKTLAEKCVWSQKFTEVAYCGVPSQLPSGTYPDAWYLGYTTLRDNIWELNAKTGTANQVASLLNLGNALIDTINLQLDSSDNYLVFMNKNDLSLWSLDLVAAR